MFWGQVVPALSQSLLWSRDRILYFSKIISILKFGIHGDMAKPHGTITCCDTSPCPSSTPQAQGAAWDAQSTPRQRGEPGPSSEVWFPLASAHFHVNMWGHTDAAPTMPWSPACLWARGHWGCSVLVGHTMMLLLLQSLGMCLWGQGEEMDKMGLPPMQG